MRTVEDQLNLARRKEYAGKQSQLTDYERGLLDGYDDGFAAGLDEEEPHGWPHPDDEGLPYRWAYRLGRTVGALES